MAVFNPDVGNPNDPNYLNYSKVVEGPSPNTSKSLALKAFGEGLSGLAGIADKFIEGKAKIAATEGVDAIRDITTQALETATGIQPVVPQPVQTSLGNKVGDPSLLDSNASADVPVGVQGGLTRMGTLSAARQATSGKNDTLYVQQLTSLAKNLRAQYPGYRDYIDAQISSMTGMNPANAYVNSLLADIKTQQGGIDKIWNEAYSDVRKNAGATADNVSSSEMSQYLLNNRNNPDAIARVNQWVYKVNADKSIADHNTLVVTQGQQNDAQLKASAETLFTTRMDSKYNNHFYASVIQGGGTTPAKLAEQMADEAINPGSHNAVDMQKAAQMMAGKRDALVAEMRYDASQLVINPATGKPALDSRGNTYSMNSVLGDRAEQIIQNKAKGYDAVIQAAVNKDTGTAIYSATYGIRKRADLDHGITSDPENEGILKTEWMGKNMPQGMQNLVLTKAMTAGVDAQLGNLFTDKTKNIFIPSNIKDGKISTFRQDVIDAKTGADTGGKPIDPETRFMDGLVNNIQFMADPKIPDANKVPVANYYFRPEGRRALQEFDQGYWRDPSGNPVKGNAYINTNPGGGAVWVPGREAVWDKLTAPEITTQIQKMGKLPGGQQLVKNYIDWAEADHAQMVVSEVKNLNKFQDDAKTYGIHLKWNADSGDFSFIDKNENVLRPKAPGVSVPNMKGADNFVNINQPTLDRLNDVGKNMKQIQDTLGNKQGMSAYYLDLLQRQGFRPNENIKGMDQKFYDAIANSHRENRIEDVFKKELKNNP